jgi:hypothetical protein
MQRLAKRAIAAAVGIFAVVSVLTIALVASGHTPGSGGSGLVPPARSGTHTPGDGFPTAPPNTPTPSSAALPCDHGQQKDHGECLGHPGSSTDPSDGHGAGGHGDPDDRSPP